MWDITCTLSSSSDEERMAENWIRICGFLDDITFKKGKGPTLFEDVISIQVKSGRRGLIFFEDSRFEIQDKNSPNRTYLIDIQMGYVPCRGSAVSHVKPPIIILLIKAELV